MGHNLHDYWTDELIGPATADQIALSDATLRWGGDGMIHIDGLGRVCAFGNHVVPGPEYRCVFTQPDAAEGPDPVERWHPLLRPPRCPTARPGGP